MRRKTIDFRNKNTENIVNRVNNIKTGNIKDRDRFISDYIPFIIKAITQITHRYVRIKNDDEFSIGLEAFNEAIDKYNGKKGSFLAFAKLIIRSRLTDYFRKEQQSLAIVMEKDEMEVAVKKQSESQDFTKKYDLKEQIIILQEQLKDFNISFLDLTEQSPKHMDTRLNCISAAKLIVSDKQLINILQSKKVIPVKQMIKYGYTKKFLKRNRKFIISTVLVLVSQLDIIKEYILSVERRGENVL